jgi:PIN domain nuclease of toxin-antitoxin system
MNGPNLFSLDTHAVYWQIVDQSRLSPAALGVFMDGGLGRAVLIVSHVVIAELFYLFQKHRQSALYPAFIHRIELSPMYRVEPIVLEDLRQMASFSSVPEMHDRLIAIQAARLGAVLVTKDRSLQASPQVKWLW